MSSVSDSGSTETIPIQYSVIIMQQKEGGKWSTSFNESDATISFVGWLSESFSYNATAEYQAPFQVVMGAGGLVNVMSLLGAKMMAPVMTAQLWAGSETPEFSMQVELVANTDPLVEIKQPILNLLKLVTPSTKKDEKSGATILESPGPSMDSTKAWEQLKSAFPMLGELEQFYDSGEGTLSATEQKTGLTNAQAAKKNQPVAKSGSTVDTSQQEGSTPTDDSSSMFEAGYWISNVLKNQISISIGTYLYFPSVVITNVECEFKNQLGPNGWPMQATVSINFKPMFLPTQDDLATMFGGLYGG